MLKSPTLKTRRSKDITRDIFSMDYSLVCIRCLRSKFECCLNPHIWTRFSQPHTCHCVWGLFHGRMTMEQDKQTYINIYI